jgi:hypothetical protein
MTNFASPHKQTTKPKSQITNHKSQNKIKQAPSIIISPHPKYQHHKISSQNQYHHKTPRSMQQTYRRDAVLPNEKDGPNMTTAQCNRPRRCSYLKCVRDGERTKDNEKTARHPTTE